MPTPNQQGMPPGQVCQLETACPHNFGHDQQHRQADQRAGNDVQVFRQHAFDDALEPKPKHNHRHRTNDDQPSQACRLPQSPPTLKPGQVVDQKPTANTPQIREKIDDEGQDGAQLDESDETGQLFGCQLLVELKQFAD